MIWSNNDLYVFPVACSQKTNRKTDEGWREYTNAYIVIAQTLELYLRIENMDETNSHEMQADPFWLLTSIYAHYIWATGNM